MEGLFDPMIVFSDTLTQQNCGGGTANSDAFVVSAAPNLNNICT